MISPALLNELKKERDEASAKVYKLQQILNNLADGIDPNKKSPKEDNSLPENISKDQLKNIILEALK